MGLVDIDILFVFDTLQILIILVFQKTGKNLLVAVDIAANAFRHKFAYTHEGFLSVPFRTDVYEAGGFG